MATKEQDLLIKIKADTTKAESQVKGISKQVDKLKTSSDKLGKSTTGVKKLENSFGGLKTTMLGLVAGFTALGVATKALEFTKLAADADQSADAFTKVFEEMGLNAEAEFQKIKDASYGLIPEGAIRQSAVTAVSLGVPLQNLAGLMEVARAKAREMGTDAASAFNDLAIGIGRGSPMILDNLGLTIKLEDANQKYAEQLGKTTAELSKEEKQIALTNAVLEAGAPAIERYAEAGLSAKENAQALNAQLAELKVNIGKELLPAYEKLVIQTTDFIKSINDDGTVKKYGDNLARIARFATQVADAFRYINDRGAPDLGREEDLTVMGEAWERLKALATIPIVIADSIDALVFAQDELFKQNKEYDELADKVKEFTGTAEEFDSLEEALKKTITEASRLHTAWKNSPTEQYNEEISGIEKVLKALGEQYTKLQEKKPFDTATENAKEAKGAVEDLGDAVKKLTKEEAEEYAKFNQERIKDHEATLKTLLKDEATLAKDIIKINNDLAKEFERISDARFDNNHSRTKAIAELEIGLLHETKQYAATEELEAAALAKAKEALKQGEYDKYKQYLDDYEQYAMASADRIGQSGNTEATAKQTALAQIAIHKEIMALNEQMYAQQEQDALALHNNKVQQHNAELDLIKKKLTAEKIAIELMKDFVEELTGKTLDVDTSDVDDFIDKLGEAQQELITLDETKAAVQVEDTQVDEVKTKIEEVKQETATPIIMTVEAVDGTTETVDLAKANGEATGIELEITTKDSTKAEIAQIEQREEAESIEKDLVFVFDEKTKRALDKEIKELEKSTESEHFIEVDNSETDDAKISNEINTISMHDIEVDNTETEDAVELNKEDTWSYHTIYVEEVDQAIGRADGGPIPQKLATGGMFTGSGRVPGYDSSDSDMVNAYLTGGEFVIKRKAVDLYGMNFLKALNSMSLAKPKGYAAGGLVTNSSAAAQTTIGTPIILNIGGSTFQTMADGSVAAALQNYINTEGGL